MPAVSVYHSPFGSRPLTFSAKPTTTLDVSFPPSTTERPPIDMAPDAPSVFPTESEEQSVVPESDSITHPPESSRDSGDNQDGMTWVVRGSRNPLEVTVDWIGKTLDDSTRNSIEEIVKGVVKRHDDDEYPGHGTDFSSLLEGIRSALSAAFGWSLDKMDSAKGYWDNKLLVGVLVVRGVATLIWVGLRLTSADHRPGLEYLNQALDAGGYYLGQIPRLRLPSIVIGTRQLPVSPSDQWNAEINRGRAPRSADIEDTADHMNFPMIDSTRRSVMETSIGSSRESWSQREALYDR